MKKRLGVDSEIYTSLKHFESSSLCISFLSDSIIRPTSDDQCLSLVSLYIQVSLKREGLLVWATRGYALFYHTTEELKHVSVSSLRSSPRDYRRCAGCNIVQLYEL
ncbi:uncharacterized protein PHALS_02960 [Plasmopara halstedii]|uniref:Uncharacterized protein n=1 Tax=Plasmopara halstedii TaxID=4781 RepID=A0A0P1AX09_PLAHL|nr:uncharacterized protein PHALS_02960 [Plasmopara halstedii]CEG46562.1 hypothetical protein PHALS_02960 [Plasmopara halstedii]|eukprot:XP_024582931.1 hypothetical protein PHALS_02960 [Plasmopara halstedii]